MPSIPEKTEEDSISTEDFIEKNKNGIDLSDDSATTRMGIKQIGYLDLSKIKDGTKKRLVFANLGTTENQKEEQECEGVIILDKNRKKIRCKLFSYDLPIERCELNEFYEDEEVIFVVNSRPQDKNPSKPYYFATNLRPKED